MHNLTDEQVARINRALVSKGNSYHQHADNLHNSGSFDARDTWREEGNACYQLARELRAQKESN